MFVKCRARSEVMAQRSEINPNEVFVVSGLLVNFNQGLVGSLFIRGC